MPTISKAIMIPIANGRRAGNNNNDGERERGRGGNGGRVAAERGGAKAQDVSKYLKKGAKSEYNKSIKLSSPHGTPVPTRSKGDPSAAVARHRNSLPKDSNKPPGKNLLSTSNHQTVKSSNRQLTLPNLTVIKPSNHQTVKSPNRQTLNFSINFNFF